jgi:hypothetical protein
MTCRGLAGAVAVLTAFAGLPWPAAAQDAGFRYRRLDLDLVIEPEHARLEVRGRAVLEATAAQLSELALGVNTRTLAMRIERLETPGVSTRVELSVDLPLHRATLTPSQPLVQGDTLAIEFTLHLEAPSAQLVIADSVALASWTEAWYPIPLAAGNRMVAWAAPGRTRFHLPRGWRAVSNGVLGGSETRPDSSVIEVWEAEEAVYRSFAAAPYRVARADAASGHEIGVYLLRADTASARRQATVLARAIGAMEEAWGPYPYAGYLIAEVPDHAVTWAASSEQGFIMATSRQFGVDGNLPLFAHEAAHAWWGNRVNSTGAGSQLVSESLAQYGAVLAIEALEGADAMADFLRFSRDDYNPLQSALGYFEIVRRGGDRPLAQLSNGEWDHNLSDSKGHWFYHMLRQRLGDDRFFGVLREIQREYAGRALSLPELRASFTRAAPEDSTLPVFLAQWLDRTGAPVLEHSWWSIDRGGAVRLELKQVQADLYDLPISIEIRLRNGHRVRRSVRLTERTQIFELPVHARPVGLEIDPDHHLLHWRPEYGPRPDPLAGAAANKVHMKREP